MPHSEDDPRSLLWLNSYPAAVRWDADVRERPVHDIIDETIRMYGTRPAFDFLGKKWTWAQIGLLVDRTARGLQMSGLRKGDCIGLFLPNTPYYLVFYYAILKAGGVVVNFNPLYPERELRLLLADSGVRTMVTLDLEMLYGKMRTFLEDSSLQKLVVCSFTDILPFPKNILFPLVKKGEIANIDRPDRCVRFKDLIANDGKPHHVPVDPQEDVAVLQFTGGTTGTPKAAMLTHANISANVEQSALWFHKARPGEDRMLGVIPFFHVFAMTAVMNMSVRCAFEIIALPRFDLEETLKTIARKKPHYFPAVPAVYGAVNHHPKLAQYNLTSLRYCISGGAALPVEVKKTFEKNTGCVVVEGYGLSESSPVVCANPIEGENRAGSIGLPLPRTIVEIISLADGETPVPAGERGELCVRGPQVMKGYLNKPGETALVLRNGRLHTGDVAIMDADGYVSIVDRIKDMIITNGYNVYPRNVEEAIHLHEGVAECIVAGIPDESRGETVKAWIRLKPRYAITTEEMREFLKDKLSPMEIPRIYEFRIEPLPKTMIGKLSRKDVLAQEREKNRNAPTV